MATAHVWCRFLCATPVSRRSPPTGLVVPVIGATVIIIIIVVVVIVVIVILVSAVVLVRRRGEHILERPVSYEQIDDLRVNREDRLAADARVGGRILVHFILLQRTAA